MKHIYFLFILFGFNTYAQDYSSPFSLTYSESDSTYHFESKLDTTKFYIRKLTLHYEGAPGVYSSLGKTLNYKQINMLKKYPNTPGYFIIDYRSKDGKAYKTSLVLNN